jgi:hypothetical protein
LTIWRNWRRVGWLLFSFSWMSCPTPKIISN